MIPKKPGTFKGAMWSVLDNNTSFSVWPWNHSEAEAQAKAMYRKPVAMTVHPGIYGHQGIERIRSCGLGYI